ncbi:pseudaminic acid synthase [Polynucleobacter paneuropaeus]|nr:pseudaminic acid synthase [Polynucleobacter paneuropaeus]
MFEILGRKIGDGFEPYIIAELSANHNGSIIRAKESIRLAKCHGAHAVKLQTYSADTMTIDSNRSDFIVKGGLWDGRKLYDLYNEAALPFDWHNELFNYAKEIGITCFSTPFDESAVDLLESLDAPAYKIASFELTDIPLIKRVAKSQKPILMSTGMASEAEIAEAIEAARGGGCNSLLLFHCISSYPTPLEDANLSKILNLQKTFKLDVGLSDHTLGTAATTISIALGACAIEKHFTISRADGGPDSAFSMEPSELGELVRQSKSAWLALGSGEFARPAIEATSLAFRRSIYFVKNCKKGDLITHKNIRRIRPGYGLPPKYFDDLVGRVLNQDVSCGDPVSWDLIA